MFNFKVFFYSLFFTFLRLPDNYNKPENQCETFQRDPEIGTFMHASILHTSFSCTQSNIFA